MADSNNKKERKRDSNPKQQPEDQVKGTVRVNLQQSSFHDVPPLIFGWRALLLRVETSACAGALVKTLAARAGERWLLSNPAHWCQFRVRRQQKLLPQLINVFHPGCDHFIVPSQSVFRLEFVGESIGDGSGVEWPGWPTLGVS